MQGRNANNREAQMKPSRHNLKLWAVILSAILIAATASCEHTSSIEQEYQEKWNSFAISLRAFLDEPGMSADKIAFSAMGDLYLVTLDGVETINLDYPVREITWSPDGNSLLLNLKQSGSNPYHDLVIVSGSDWSDRKYVQKRIAYCNGIDWSPDGKHIVYSCRPAESEWKRGIYIADKDGKNHKLLTSDGCQPTWSPDGSRIAFIGYQGGPKVEVIEPDNPNSRRTVYTLEDGSCDRETTNPSWFPDSRRLLVSNSIKQPSIQILDLDQDSASTSLDLTDQTGQVETSIVQAIALSDGRHIVYKLFYNEAGCKAISCYFEKLLLWNLADGTQKEISLHQGIYYLGDFDWWHALP